MISLLGTALCFPGYLYKRVAQSSAMKVAHNQCCCFLTGLLPFSKKCRTLLIPQEGKQMSKPQKVTSIVTIPWELHSHRLLSTARRTATTVSQNQQMPPRASPSQPCRVNDKLTSRGDSHGKREHMSKVVFLCHFNSCGSGEPPVQTCSPVEKEPESVWCHQLYFSLAKVVWL